MKKERIQSLDILRTVALVLICVYHWFSYRGTYIGVIIFFALSGYLVTTGLLSRDFSVFSVINRRLRKVYPSLLIVILISTIALYFVNNGLEMKYKYSALFSILGLNNIYQIFSKMSYFDNFGIILPLTHIWALSFLIQMYIFFPPLLQGLKKLKLKNNAIGIIFFGIGIISALIMAYVFYITSKSPEGADFSRIYYGTDTRAFAFFCPAAIACFYTNREIKKDSEKKIVYILGILGLFSLIFFCFGIDYRSAYNYYGLMFLSSVLIGFTLVLFSKPELKKFDLSKYPKIFNPIIRLGQHQYQYYLWQYPIMIFAREYFKWTKLSNIQQFFIQIIVLVAISELSYFLFEKKSIKYISYPVLISIFVILIYSPIYENKDLEEMKAAQAAAANATTEEPEPTPTATPTTNTLNGNLTMDELLTAINSPSKGIEEETKIQNEILKKYPNDERNILFIGDSVLDMTKIDLKKKYPNSIIETKVGRQFYELPNMLKNYAQNGKLRKIIVIALGTNGTIYEKDMKSVLETLKGHDIYFINTVMPDPWQDSVNAEIKKASAENPNIKVIDWYSYSKGKQEYFYKDGTHPKPHAAKRYINLLYSVLSKDILNSNTNADTNK
ncbi:acyltransferase family protein [Leptotrichia sp. oral taxon 223]|uniref:acyltransferase family protein n=1 Tax=Leptotrichia sp. oral taxon 223 TaxID=712363 RepID=UPI0015BD0B15|nr:acyltransferase family protein [Leptotrichia sp. oral taxon 223]NWO19477.1 acetyltransferase [Leptotrichia sp. oral taxon 223]